MMNDNYEADTFFHGLRDLAYETGDEVVAAYARYIQRRPRHLREDLVLAMTRALVENRRHALEMYERLLRQCHSPAVITIKKLDLDLSPGDLNGCIEKVQPDIYFRDYLRALWRRLTRRWKA